MSLLLAAITHLGCFVAILIDLPLLTWLQPLIFWRIFFAIYCGIATFVVALAINQLKNFLSHVDEIIAKEHEMEGYETVQHSAEYWDYESNTWASTDSGF